MKDRRVDCVPFFSALSIVLIWILASLFTVFRSYGLKITFIKTTIFKMMLFNNQESLAWVFLKIFRNGMSWIWVPCEVSVTTRKGKKEVPLLALDLPLPLAIDTCYATQATWIVLISSIFGGDWDDLNDHIEQAYTYHLLTGSEVITGKSHNEALMYWPRDSEVNTWKRLTVIYYQLEENRPLSSQSERAYYCSRIIIQSRQTANYSSC